jgi:hypothetical protein
MVIARRELNRAAKRAEAAAESGDDKRHAPVTGTDGSAEPAKATT